MNADEFDGHLEATTVAAKILIGRADERIKISLASLARGGTEGMHVAHDYLTLGTEPESRVTYRIVGWDSVSAYLLAVKGTPDA